MRRPPSLSESYLPDYKFLSGRLDTDRIKPLGEFYRSINIEPIFDSPGDLVVVEPQTDCCEYATEYMLRFLLHITMISFFETLFFFQFVSKDEDNGINYISSFYTNIVTNSCTNLSSVEKVLVDDVLNKLFNSTSIIQQGVLAEAKRQLSNNKLNVVSWVYFAGLTGAFFAVAIFSVIRKHKVRWASLFIENLVFVTMLGIYEFMFFETIIKKYMTLSPDEISRQFILGLQNKCGIL